MMCFKPVLVVFLFSCVFLFHPPLIVSVNHRGNSQAVAQYDTGDVAINCGSVGNSTAQDGREWIGESASNIISGQSKSSIVVDKSFLGVDPVPYMTSRISASPFHFTFLLNPGQKFLRFHFYPASYRGFEKYSTDLFNVNAGPFTLLNDFSPTLTSDRLGVKYLVKEFCLNVEERGKLSVTFSPSQSGNLKKHIAYAFVNGIEIISMPTGLYYTPDGDLGAPIVGQNNRFYSIDNSTALETVQRLNIGGNFVSSVEDFGLFRRWTTDAGYFVEYSGDSRVNYMGPKLAYANVPFLIAPLRIYHTSWKTAARINGEHQLYSFTWKIPINIGFGYLVRLHFCDLDAAMPGNEQKEFSILIHNQLAETDADVIRWSGGAGFPVYKDFVVMMKGGKEGSESHLFIVLRSHNGLALGLLKALEIFKLSNLDNCLATPDPASFKEVSTTWNLKIQRFFSLFSQSNVIGTGMTIIIFIISTTVYSLRIIWEENVNNEKDAQFASVEPSCRRFSLADIMLATQNFSDEFIIGRGGFGKVYKGFISGVEKIVAIKRLSFFSRQGAREFWTEIETLSKLRHIHLVTLIGYCNENQEMILVYEYIPGGTLADNLYKFARNGKACALLGWEQRLRICIGAARGLEYLHTGSEYGIIHRDVKDTNILLDENFMPKISDLGLSKHPELTELKSYVSTNIKGTVGYLDPDYCTTHRLTRKSDVYSFGVVMLVVLSGRPALDTTNPGERESLVACFQECLSNREFDKIVDPNLYQKISPESLKEFLKSVENCLQQQSKNRPTMDQLVGNLEQVLQLQERPIISASQLMGSLEQALQLQERPVISASGDAVVAVQHFELETVQSGEIMSQGSVITRLEQSVVPPPREEITRTKALSREVHNRVRKPFWSRPRKMVQSRGDESAGSILDGIPVDKFVKFSYKELATATGDFSLPSWIGRGGFDTFYYSELRGEKVAIKEISRESLAAFSNLARVHHRNLVRLLGYCDEGSQRSLFLVFEHVDNGNLERHLRGSVGEPVLSWWTRVKIALDSARALEYIHEHTVPGYIHCHIRSSSILIDTSFHAKIVAGFGLKKLTEVESSSVTDEIVGIATYRAPEYAFRGRVSPKGDVYAFGVVLYELISPKTAFLGRQCIGEDTYLVKVFHEVLSQPDPNYDLGNLVDVRLGHNYPFRSVLKMAQLARACTQEAPQLRPSMSSVVVELITLSTVSSSISSSSNSNMGMATSRGTSRSGFFSTILSSRTRS